MVEKIKVQFIVMNKKVDIHVKYKDIMGIAAQIYEAIFGREAADIRNQKSDKKKSPRHDAGG